MSVCVESRRDKGGCQNLTAQPPVHSVSLSVSLSFTVKISHCQAKVNDPQWRELQLDKLSKSSWSQKTYNVANSRKTYTIPYPLSAEHWSWQKIQLPFLLMLI